MGAVLGQVDDDGNEYMVACISRSNNKHELNYASYTGELLCVVWAVKTLRPMLHGRKFTVVTDHRPLTWLMTAKDLTGKYARWALALQEHEFEVRYREGAKHQNADALSRMPQESTQDCSGARLDDEHPAALTGMLLDGGKEVPGRAFALACAPSDCDLTDVLLHACAVEVHDDAVSQLVSSADHLLRDGLGLPLVAPLPDACVDVLSAQASLARWATTALTVA